MPIPQCLTAVCKLGSWGRQAGNSMADFHHPGDTGTMKSPEPFENRVQCWLGVDVAILRAVVQDQVMVGFFSFVLFPAEYLQLLPEMCVIYFEYVSPFPQDSQ